MEFLVRKIPVVSSELATGLGETDDLSVKNFYIELFFSFFGTKQFL